MALLKKKDIHHLVRAVSAVTTCKAFVMVGTGAVIATTRPTPAALMQTREIDIYPTDTADPDAMADLIEGSLGPGSQFDRTFGYYADGVSPATACLPDDWTMRAIDLRIVGAPGVTVSCPSPGDIALSKLCAWREKDLDWLKPALRHGIADIRMMRAGAARMTNVNAPPREEIARRLDVMSVYAPPG